MSPAIDRPSNNDNSQPEDALIPERAPRITTEVQRSPAPSHATNQNLFAVLVKNRRQITSLTAGLIVLLGSGVHTVWTFWEIYSTSSWFEAEVAITVAAWYVATAIGSAIASMLVSKWSKRKLYLLSAILLLLSSLLFTARLITELRVNSVIFSGRFLAGLANGFAYLTVITHAAENAVNQIRGVILRGMGYVLAFSLFVAGFTTAGFTTAGSTTAGNDIDPDLLIGNDIDSELLMGYVNLFYAVLALVLCPLLTIESAPFLLRQSNDGRSVSEREALVIGTMARLRDEKAETPRIRHDFAEMKHQLNEDELDSSNPFGRKNFRPLCIVSGVRVLSVCAKNVPFTVLIMGFLNHLAHQKTISLYVLLLLLTCRFIFGMLTMFFIDKFERKKYLYLSCILCGILLLISCIIVLSTGNHIFESSPYLTVGIIAFFIFASMSIDCVGHVQTSEAFSYATKPWSITIAISVEHFVHILFIAVFKLKSDVLTFVLISVGLMVVGMSTLLKVPSKTKGLSLRQTRDIYRNVDHIYPSENA